jgi:hypothetical protein
VSQESGPPAWQCEADGTVYGRLGELGQLVDDSCPECGEELGAVWRVTVDTNMQEYTPVFGERAVLDIVRCNNCNISFERIEGGSWRRQESP